MCSALIPGNGLFHLAAPLTVPSYFKNYAVEH